MRRLFFAAMSTLFVLGCAPIASERPPAACACEDGEAPSLANERRAREVVSKASADTSTSGAGDGGSGDETRVIFSDVPDRWATKRIGASTAAASRERPRRARKVHIELEDTPFDEAARFLSDAGGFNVVVEATGSPVTTSLHDVEPFDALYALAEARGLEITYERGVVIVR